jgi:surface protein
MNSKSAQMTKNITSKEAIDLLNDTTGMYDVISDVILKYHGGMPFISTWSVNDNKQVQLPLEKDGVYDFVVEWGDGTSDFITEYYQPEVVHKYCMNQEYTITITGSIRGFNMHKSKFKKNLLCINQWGSLQLGNNGYYFRGCKNVNIVAIDVPDLSGTTNMYGMFENASFNGDISKWDTSAVTSMLYMFYRATSFNGDLSKWDTSAVTDMSHMFQDATSFNGDLSKWDTSAVTRMYAMFFKATSFNGDISKWDTSAMTNMYAKWSFRNC